MKVPFHAALTTISTVLSTTRSRERHRQHPAESEGDPETQRRLNIALEDIAAELMRLALARNALMEFDTPLRSTRIERCGVPRHSGILSCFFQGFARSFVRSSRSARATRRRVECGMITSSI